MICTVKLQKLLMVSMKRGDGSMDMTCKIGLRLRGSY